LGKNVPNKELVGRWKFVNVIAMFHTFPIEDQHSIYESCIDIDAIITDTTFTIQPIYGCFDSVIGGYYDEHKYYYKGIETFESDSIRFDHEYRAFIFDENNIRTVKVFRLNLPIPDNIEMDSVNLYYINEDKMVLALQDILVVMRKYKNGKAPQVEPFYDVLKPVH